MDSQRSSAGVTADQVLALFADLDRPSTPLTAADVAEELDCEPETARESLESLTERGSLRSRRIDGTEVWWTPSGTLADHEPEHEEFAAFVSAVQDYAIFMLDPDGTVVSWNDGAERIKGYSEAEIVGQHFSTFYTEEDRAEDVPATNLERATEDGRVEDEGWRVRDDGSRFWANVTITAIRDDEGQLQGFTKVTRDMTERREYEQELRRERDFSERILETVPISIGLLDDDGKFVRANERVLERIGVDESSLDEYSVTAWDVYDADGEPVPREEWPWRRVLDTGEAVYDYECRVDLPDVGERWLSLNAAPIEAGDRDEDLVVVSIDDVTNQKERERRLRREYDQTRKLLQTAPIAIAVQNADGETVMANDRAQDALGLSGEQFLGTTEADAELEVYDEDGEPVPPEAMPGARALASGEPVFDEYLVVEAPAGERLQFHVNATPLFGPDGEVERVVIAAEDVTELKERERQLEQRKTELETELGEILGRISDAFYALDDDWRFTHLNDQAARLMDRSRDELLGTEAWEVLPDAEEDVYRDRFLTAMETQEPDSFEEYDEEMDAWFEFNVYPSESGLSVYFHDVTERKEYQRRLEESNERLEQFAYAASHDLQEPLRMISSYLRLVEQRYTDELDEDGREFVEYAVDGADRMREMITGLLEYSRVESEGEPLEPVDLDDLLEEVRSDLQLQIAETDADVAVESLPRVQGDRNQLRQLFQNLLDNALTYAGDEPPDVDITAERGPNRWTIAVSDDGVGIDPEAQESIFEVFERLHSRDEYAGTGIGLALCQRIVDRHGGEIWVESEPGEGSTFYCTLVPAGAEDEL